MAGGEREAEAQRIASIERTNQPVVPQPGGGVIRIGLLFVLSSNGRANFFDLLGRGLRPLHAAEANVGKHRFGGVGSHRCDPAVGPGKEKARVEASAAHAVVASAVRTADEHRELRDSAVGHSSDHLGAILRDATDLGVTADHIAGGVLKEQQRDRPLVAQLDEVRGFQRVFGEDDAVVRDDADLVAPDPGEAHSDRGAPFGFELSELAGVDQPADDLARIERNLGVGVDDAEQVFCRVGWRLWFFPVEPSVAIRDRALVGVLAQLPEQPVGLGLGLDHVIRHAALTGVQCCATEVVWVDDFAESGLHDGWTAEEDPADSLDHDHFIRQSGHVGAPRRAATEDNRKLGKAGCRHASLAIEGSSKVILVGEHLVLHWQESSTRVDEVDAAKVVLERDVLGPNLLFDASGEEGAALYGGVVGDEHPRDAMDDADSGDDAGARELIVDLAEPSERGEFEKGRAFVDDHVDAIAGHDLAAAVMPVDRPLATRSLGMVAAVDRELQSFRKRGEVGSVGGGVRREQIAISVDGVGYWSHQLLASPFQRVPEIAAARSSVEPLVGSNHCTVEFIAPKSASRAYPSAWSSRLGAMVLRSSVHMAS